MRSAIKEGVEAGVGKAMDGFADKFVDRVVEVIHRKLRAEGMPKDMDVFTYVRSLQARIVQLEAELTRDTEER